jgi:hypothetical protein
MIVLRHNKHTHSQPQQILLFPSTRAICGGHTERSQALKKWYLNLRIIYHLFNACGWAEFMRPHKFYKH